uniref:DDE Tnp4 domain-containing protein n=1 Tax=Stegastes partitus TaxID=144197 RepID=A0A3B4ZVD9_9TELE
MVEKVNLLNKHYFKGSNSGLKGLGQAPLSTLLHVASPFVENPLDLGAQIIRGCLWRERVFRDYSDPFTFSDNGIHYISTPPTAPQSVCIALCFFATGTCMHSVGDAEHLSKNTVCCAILGVVPALVELLNKFVAMPGHLLTLAIKEGFYKIASSLLLFHYINHNHWAVGEHDGDFVNRKSNHSINVQMTCNHQLTVTSLDARWPGSVHDCKYTQRDFVLIWLFDGLLVGDGIPMHTKEGPTCATGSM